ncbi:MAG: hypothetical protein IJ064_05525 [Bacteroidaceae bacterium]|nr:hypothetical protein [Bacteroidaceae bacterium]
MEEKKVYLLYEGDKHLTKSSLVLMGVFDSKANLMTGANELVGKRVNDNWDGLYNEDEQTEEEAKFDFIWEQTKILMDDYQTHEGNVLFYICEASMNVVEEVS